MSDVVNEQVGCSQSAASQDCDFQLFQLFPFVSLLVTETGVASEPKNKAGIGAQPAYSHAESCDLTMSERSCTSANDPLH